MRDLIKPTLLAIVRLGLALSIACCIISQWWHADFGVQRWRGSLCADGYASKADLLPAILHYSIRRGSVSWQRTQQGEVRPSTPGADVEYSTSVPGVSYWYFRDLPSVWGVYIRHWLVIFLFVLAYTTLKIVYRWRSSNSGLPAKEAVSSSI